MKTPFSSQRRLVLGAATTLPLIAAGGLGGMRQASAQSDSATPNANKHSFALGDFEVSTLLAGSRTVEEPPVSYTHLTLPTKA